MTQKQNWESAYSEILNDRRAIKFFDKNVKVSAEVIQKGIEHAILAPTSLNLQHWEFYAITSDEEKQKYHTLCLDQPSATTASALVVVVARPDLVPSRSKKILAMAKESAQNPESESFKKIEKLYNTLLPAIHKPFTASLFNMITAFKNVFSVGMVTGTMRTRYIESHSSCAMAANNFMLSMTAQGFDTCPMMGIDSKRVRKQLGLPKSAEINMVIGVGKKSEERSVYGERTRLPINEVLKTL